MNQDLKSQSTEERRKAPRFDLFLAMPTLKSINRVDGHEVSLINISRRGALIDTREQMSAGSHIFLRMVTAETVYIVKGRIIRCGVSPTNDRTFQTAIEFDKDFAPLPASIRLLKLFEDEDFLK
jgi:hypothetical protein